MAYFCSYSKNDFFSFIPRTNNYITRSYMFNMYHGVHHEQKSGQANTEYFVYKNYKCGSSKVLCSSKGIILNFSIDYYSNICHVYYGGTNTRTSVLKQKTNL